MTALGWVAGAVLTTPRTRALRLTASAVAIVFGFVSGCSSPTPEIVEDVSVVTADPDVDLLPTVMSTPTHEANYPAPAPSSTPLPEGYVAPDR